MNRQEILDNIKQQFKKMMNFADSPSTTPFTTTDGKNIVVIGEDLSVGCEIYLLDDNNQQTPLDNGDYTLTDGRKITVTDNKVENIMAPNPAEQTESPVEPAKMEMGDGMPDEMPTENETENDGTNVEARLSALEQQIQEVLQMLAGTMTQTEKMMNSQVEMSETVRKIAEEPAGEKPKARKVYVTDKEIQMSSSMDEIRNLQKRMNSVKGL